jgi:hypothetical protein
MQDVFAFVKDSLDKNVRRSWVEYYEKFGAVRMDS